MPPASDEVRRLHDEAHREREARLERMTPIERMEEAYRLFRLTHGPEEAQE